MMKAQQVHALRACSLVAIPPSEERTPPPGGFPRDLSGMNLTSWAGLIQDVAQGMKVVPPNLSMEVCLDSMVLLQLLEATTGMGYCRICCQPSPQCHCLDDYQLAPTETWSQMMARMPGQGVVASIGGPTTPGTATDRGTGTRSAFTSTWPSPTRLHQLEPTSPSGSTDWGTTSAFRRSAQHQKTDSRPMGPRSMGPSTTYAGTKCPPGNADSSSAEAAPACYSLPAGSAVTKPVCYSLPAGGAATQEASGEGIDSPTPLRQSCSCSQPNHPRPWKAAGQGIGHQRQISQLPQTRVRDDNQCSLEYHTGSHATPTRPSFKAQTP